jgi:deoxyribodipyrimidine photo-lyase
MRTLVWFRGKDLRVADHAPLCDAVAQGEVVPLFVLDPYFFAPKRARELPHRIQFLLDGLHELEAKLAELGSRLVVVEGKSVEVVPKVAAHWKVDRVVAHRWCEPFARERDRRVRKALRVPFELYEGETLEPPGTNRTGGGKPFSVFTPFSRSFARALVVGEPLAAPKRVPAVPRDVRTRSARIPTCRDLGIAQNPRILHGGESEGRKRLRAFVSGPARRYDALRNRLDLDGTSRLSADLKFGTVSVRTVWTRVTKTLADTAPAACETFLKELVWREFTHSTLWDRPELLAEPFRAEWHGFPWRRDERGWRAWIDGTTGYPVVDAAARQLLGEGFVHNRARMIAASFLTKHLVVDYRRGEAHYMKFLTDGDWAQNNFNWQWAAGSGCDAQPWFRIFNPVKQGETFDPNGDYVRRWVPELAGLAAKHIHEPWKAPASVLESAKIELGRTYPRPVVDHAFARDRFLALAREHLRSSE